jgi:steroid delta-isomerase-like uncharacterized protein
LKGESAMSEQNKALSRRVIEEVWHKRDLDVVDELYADDFVYYGAPSTGAVLHGPEGYKQVVAMYKTAFPDLRFTIEELIAEGDKVVTRWTFRGTHRGELMGIAPTGKAITNSGISIARISGGKIVEERAIWDELHSYRQLGVYPPDPAGE